AGYDLPNPEVVVADERVAPAVGRCHRGRSLRARLPLALRAADVARPAAAAAVEGNGFPVGAEIELVERKAVRRVGGARGGRQSGSHLRLIEGRRPRAGGGVDQEELGPVSVVVRYQRRPSPT